MKMCNRIIYKRILTPIAEKRIANDECPTCGKHKSQWNRRTSWTCCCKECTEKFWEEHDKSVSWQQQRYKALRRDNYTCQKCGNKYAITYKGLSGKMLEAEEDGKLQVDHIKPIAIGGDSLDLDNLQTLCVDCHRLKTAEDMKVIAEYKRMKNILQKNKQLSIM